MTIERFECIRRGSRVVTFAACNVDHAIGQAPCAACPVGETHGRYELARAWPDGSPVRWLGEQPVFAEPEPVREASAEELEDDVASGRSADADHEPPRSEERSDRRVPAVAPPSTVPPSVDRSAPRATEVPALPAEEERMPKREPRLIEWNGKKLTTGQWAEEPEVQALGLTANALYMRLRDGWGPALALTMPKGSRLTGDDERVRETPPKPPAPRTAEKPAGASKKNGKGVAKPKPDAEIEPWAQAALAGIDERFEALEAELAKLAIAGNAICDAAGIEQRYEVSE